MKGKIKSSSGLIYEVEVPEHLRASVQQEHYIVCPICTPTRKPQHKNQKKLAINLESKPYRWRCNHCNESGIVKTEGILREQGIETLKVKSTFLELPKDIKNYINSRGISDETIKELRISHSLKNIRQSKHPDPKIKDKILRNVKCISFPYYKYGYLINVKYRDKRKNFKLEYKASKIFWNIDAIGNSKYAIITEGEFDTAACVEVGYKASVSVPNGATVTEEQKKQFEKEGRVTISSKGVSMEYMDNSISDFDDVETIIIATDFDAAGIVLREELARRLGKHRCKYIDYARFNMDKNVNMNDPNQILKEMGKSALIELIEDYAISYPVEGVTTANDYMDILMHEYDHGKEKGMTTGWKDLDGHFTWMKGYTVGVNGYPSEGKTTLLMNLLVSSAVIHNFKWGIYSPENYPPKNLIDTAVEILLGNTSDIEFSERIPRDEYKMAVKDFISKHFFFLDRQKPFTPDELMDKKVQMVRRHGITGFLTDPWFALNHIEQTKFGNVADYIQYRMNSETIFTERYNIINIIAHHPPTPQRKNASDKPLAAPTAFDLTGGVMLFNRLKQILSIHRHNREDFAMNTITEIHIQKSKEHKLAGIPTSPSDPILMRFDRRSSRYYGKNGHEQEYNQFPFQDHYQYEQLDLNF